MATLKFENHTSVKEVSTPARRDFGGDVSGYAKRLFLQAALATVAVSAIDPLDAECFTDTVNLGCWHPIEYMCACVTGTPGLDGCESDTDCTISPGCPWDASPCS